MRSSPHSTRSAPGRTGGRWTPSPGSRSPRPATATGTGTGQVITVPFTPKPGKFIKVVQTGSAGNWWSIAEFGAYGKEWSEIPKTDPYNNSSSGNWCSIHDLHMYGTGCGVDNGQNTIFIRPTDGANIMRARNPTGEGCKGFYGEACSGTACYYGPFGFSVASVFTYPGYPYGMIDQQFCNPSFYATPQPTYWANVTGVNPRGQAARRARA